MIIDCIGSYKQKQKGVHTAGFSSFIGLDTRMYRFMTSRKAIDYDNRGSTASPRKRMASDQSKVWLYLSPGNSGGYALSPALRLTLDSIISPPKNRQSLALRNYCSYIVLLVVSRNELRSTSLY